MPYKIEVCALSDVGLVRQQNEDFWAELPQEQFFVLADGMGGHKAGEIAARLAVENLCQIFKEKFAHSNRTMEEAQDIISEAIRQVNLLIYKMGKSHDDLKGMGTTICCILLHAEGLVVGHVGDSRVYRLRQHRLEQLTRDDSLLCDLMDIGQIQEQDAEEFMYKHILTKAIGTEPYVEPTVNIDSVLVGDTLLMCTDGLTDMLKHKDIEQILKQTPINEISQKLVKMAKQRGGRDNVTVVVVNVQDKHGSTDLSGS